MTWFDFGVLSVLVVSVAISLLHGLAREMVSLGVWVGGFILSTLFGGQVAGLLPQSLSPLLSALMGFLIVFGVVLVIGWIVGLALSSAVRASGLGPADRAVRDRGARAAALFAGGSDAAPEVPMSREE